jgi:hypothetical protein
MSALRNLLPPLLLLASGLSAGCSSPDDDWDSGVPSWGEATFQLQLTNATYEVFANLSIRYDVETPAVAFAVSGNPPGAEPDLLVPPGGDATIRWDPRSGGFTNASYASGLRQFFGPEKVLPSPRGMEWTVDASSFLPVGPNLVLAQRPGSVASSGVDVSMQAISGSWIARARAPCALACTAGQGTGEMRPDNWLLYSEGQMGELLPRLATFAHEATGATWRMERTTYVASADEIQLEALLPFEMEGMQRMELCGLVPCEPLDWPSRLSLQEGLAALLASQEWSTWRGTDDTILTLASAGARFTIETVGNTSVSEEWIWMFSFSKGGRTVETFTLRALALPGGGPPHGPITVRDQSTMESGLGEYDLAAYGTLGIDASSGAEVAAARQLDLGSVDVYSFSRTPVDYTPESDLATRVGFDSGPRSIRISFTQGKLWYDSTAEFG